jgi:V-type H+-transporting ATPase subunit a
VRRCDELERKLRYIEAEVKKDGVPIPDNLTELPRAPNPRAIIDLEVKPSRVSIDFESIDFRRFCPDHFSNLRR